jgi:hypothetical protein
MPYMETVDTVNDEIFRNLTLSSRASLEITLSSSAFRNLTLWHAKSSIRGIFVTFYNFEILFYVLLLQIM